MQLPILAVQIITFAQHRHAQTKQHANKESE